MKTPDKKKTSSALFESLVAESASRHFVHLRDTSQNAKPWIASGLSQALKKKGQTLLWITADEAQAEAISSGSQFLLSPNKQNQSDPFEPKIAIFPLHQLSPYGDLSPDRDAMAERLALLFRLVHATPPDLIVASVTALMRKVPPSLAIDSASLLLLVGQEVAQYELSLFLVRTGYLNTPLVEEPGGFCIRGGIMDVFAPQLPRPVRLEWFGDEIESIRSFDPMTQRTTGKLEEVYFGPVREILHDPESTRRAIRAVDQRALELDLPSHKLLSHKRNLKEGIRYFGIEALLPAFHEPLSSLMDYLPTATSIVLDDPVAITQASHQAFDRISATYQEARSGSNLVFQPETMFLSPRALQKTMAKYKKMSVGSTKESGHTVTLACENFCSLKDQIQHVPLTEDPLSPLTDRLKSYKREGLRVFFSSPKASRSRQLLKMLQSRGLATRQEASFDYKFLDQYTPNLWARIVPGDWQAGFVCKQAGLVIIPDAEVFGRATRKIRHAKASREMLSLKPKQVIVHQDFGVGVFQGLVKLTVGSSEADFVLLTYKDEDRLYLPITRMNLIEKYSGSQKTPPLSKLGGKAWERTKQKIHQALLEMADELVKLEALRKSRPGLAKNQPGKDFFALEESFPFEETPDQKDAIELVVSDMASKRAMDRLICGDVGFGKTEVAIRAAYLASLSGQQTLVLVPTTVLALQHTQTFKARLGGSAVQIEMLSRLTPPADFKTILDKLSSGKIDILIGTHRLLSSKINPHNLGLIIIDEEHRFGVRHKEMLKKMKTDVDVLTMTATPLPRTLQMSLTGMRDICVIRTPPRGRRSIRTMISRFSVRLVAEAIRRERSRGGQVFFVHNWVRSLPAMKRFLERVVPEAKIALAHGKMNARDLEKVMADFINHEVDVLLCTSIIGSGLDIPSANTVIVNRADRFGLAQLYQIRGRVGRSREKAFAYFFIPGMDTITDDARKRMESLADNTDLGSGYQIANRDLEIRGAGNLLGKAQSGHVKAVGFDMYSRLLEKALMEVRGQGTHHDLEPEIKLPVPGFLHESYVPQLDHRLDMYSRLSRAKSEEEVFDLEQDIHDRFGPLPPEAENLIELSILKTMLKKAQVILLEFKNGSLLFHLNDPSNQLDSNKLVQIINQQKDRVSLEPSGVIKIRLEGKELQDPIPAAKFFSGQLLQLCTSKINRHPQTT
jgi:transcription-repair coupling factor (superfamily II helicase)